MDQEQSSVNQENPNLSIQGFERAFDSFMNTTSPNIDSESYTYIKTGNYNNNALLSDSDTNSSNNVNYSLNQDEFASLWSSTSCTGDDNNDDDDNNGGGCSSFETNCGNVEIFDPLDEWKNRGCKNVEGFVRQENGGTHVWIGFCITKWEIADRKDAIKQVFSNLCLFKDTSNTGKTCPFDCWFDGSCWFDCWSDKNGRCPTDWTCSGECFWDCWSDCTSDCQIDCPFDCVIGDGGGHCFFDRRGNRRCRLDIFN